MKQLPEELQEILATTPPEEVIAKIEALDPKTGSKKKYHFY